MAADASIASIFSNFFESSAYAAGPGSAGDAPSFNSQNIPLLKANANFDPSPLKGGGDITIVDGSALLAETGPSGTLADIPEGPVSDQISIYVVRNGDTLSDIAEMFGVSINTIRWANDIKNGVIRPGETLIILPITGIRHSVAKGETIKSIAAKYKGDVNEILQFNNLKSDAALAVGDIVTIPDGEIPAPPAPRKGAASNPTEPLRNAGGPSYPGYYTSPLPFYHKTQRLHGYNAVDLGAPSGTPIFAAASGQVIVSRQSGWNGGYGNYIVIAHPNGTQTLYSHLSSNLAYSGQYVLQGQTIGYVGLTGKTTGAHLHFEVRGAKNSF